MPHARVLAASLSRCHPELDITLLVLDGGAECTEEAGACVQVVGLEGAGLNEEALRQLPMLLDARTLGEIAKAHLLRKLLDAGASVAFYLHPAAAVYSPLSELFEVTAERGVVVSPPHPRDIDPAFIAISERGRDFLNRWQAQTVTATSPALPAFEAYLLKDATCDVGYWNLSGRRLQWEEDHYAIDGKPLKWLRFSGYEPDKPHLLSTWQGDRPRVLLSEHPALAQLCEEYRQQLMAAGFNKFADWRSSLEFLPSGVWIDQPMRWLYHQALERFRGGSGPEPPSPFGPGGEKTFLQWINASLPTGGVLITRYMNAIYASRPDLQQAFPNPLGVDAAAFREWFLKHGRADHKLPDVVLPAEATGDAPAAAAASVNLAGYFNAELGLGEAARLLAATLDAGDVSFNTVGYDDTSNRQEHPFEQRAAAADAATDTNIICINPDQLPRFATRMGPEFANGRYSIGVWFWEVDEFPETSLGAFHYVDEVWVASEFMRRALAQIAPKPVFKFHLPIVKPEVDESLTRADLRLPDRFIFLFSFDFLSVLERKNPLGLIAAFQRAFRPGEGPMLVLKTINGDQRVLEMEKLKFAARSHPDIVLMDGYLAPLQKNTLTALCDCYISLHRSEGFGLTMAEAMALAKPVIATGYSGNLDFMNEHNSYLCRYSERPVGPGCDPYPASAYWAEPDPQHAATLMRHVYADRVEAMARGRTAAAELQESHSPQRAARSLMARLATIRRRRARREAPCHLALLEDRLDSLEAGQREILRRLGGSASLSQEPDA